MPGRKQSRRSISVSQDHYVTFAASCTERGVSMSATVEALISAHLESVGVPSAESMRSVRERIGKVGKGAPFVRTKPPAVPLSDRVPDDDEVAAPRSIAVTAKALAAKIARRPTPIPPEAVDRAAKVAAELAHAPRHESVVDRLAEGRTHVPAAEFEATKRAIEAKRARKPAEWTAPLPKTIRSRADRIAEDAKQVRPSLIPRGNQAPATDARPGPTKPDPVPDRGSVARSLAF